MTFSIGRSEPIADVFFYYGKWGIQAKSLKGLKCLIGFTQSSQGGKVKIQK